MNTLILVIAVSATAALAFGFVILFLGIRRAQPGYQDLAGFHKGATPVASIEDPRPGDSHLPFEPCLKLRPRKRAPVPLPPDSSIAAGH